jgi:hypothetical protein
VTRLQQQPLTQFLYGLVCLCLLLQPAGGLIHAAMHHAHAPDQAHGHAAHGHLHAHHHEHEHGALHMHIAPDADSSHSSHRPHPEEDHYSDVGDEATRPHSLHVALALAPTLGKGTVFDLPAHDPTRTREIEPQSSSRRRTAAPRAPPVV